MSSVSVLGAALGHEDVPRRDGGQVLAKGRQRANQHKVGNLIR